MSSKLIAQEDVPATEPNANRWRANGVEGSSSRLKTTLRHLGENAELHVENGRLSRGIGYASASPDARRTLARMGAVLRLRQHNRYFVHASGVASPSGGAIIFVGESGTGKSTLAFALARRGWTLLGDDGVVLEPFGPSIQVHGWRSPSLVSASLAPYFSELSGCAEQAILGDQRRRVPMSPPTASHAWVDAIVFVSRGSSGSLRPCGQAKALTSLIRQSPWVLLGDSESARHLRALQTIVGTVSTLEFEHGPAELLRIEDFFDSPHNPGTWSQA